MASTASNAPTTATMATTVSKPQRVLSVDVLRGLTIALMILVNDPGDWKHVFIQLDHAEWNGLTLTDLVFPTFLFVVGVSMVFSFTARVARGNCRKSLTGHVWARFAKLVILALALNYFPRMHWQGMRLYGVIMRIALCSLIAGMVLVFTRNPKVLAVIVIVLLVGYWALLRFVPIPGVGVPTHGFPINDEVNNLTAFVDRWALVWQHKLFFGAGALYRKTSDPEGLLSTLPSVATTLIGALIGLHFRRPEWQQGEAARLRMRGYLFGWGLMLVLAGGIWNNAFPMNKNLWTSSFVLVTAAAAMIALGIMSLLVDYRSQPWPTWLRVITWPWLVFGSNAIVAYTSSVVLVKALIYIHHTGPDGKSVSLLSWLYKTVFAAHGSTVWTSLAWAVCFVAVCFIPNWILWRKKIFVRM
ncbi:acyltransferase family protein [Bryocella elongata]|nr:heparan-alpha-glucosaminide N-acetyltransferase domain-containing protein [Bryocella elongata]